MKINWNADTGYENSSSNLPLRVKFPSTFNSAEFILQQNGDSDGCSLYYGFTVKYLLLTLRNPESFTVVTWKIHFFYMIYYFCLSQVYFHSPSDVPDYSHRSISIRKGTHTSVQVKTGLSLTDQSLESWTSENRGCYYSREKWLKNVEIYSFMNCYVECQSNYTEEICGCTHYHSISIQISKPKIECAID